MVRSILARSTPGADFATTSSVRSVAGPQGGFMVTILLGDSLPRERLQVPAIRRALEPFGAVRRSCPRACTGTAWQDPGEPAALYRAGHARLAEKWRSSVGAGRGSGARFAPQSACAGTRNHRRRRSHAEREGEDARRRAVRPARPG